ncbi:ABC transporter ATP-binding protein [Rhodoligotrophos ferricapiens]|uniref:ABC transporter ATP-binding protein n=1 Tax=Rhodoligotrophos ferricapiens TaxID=3069264 RepID=UPI00315C5284
MNALLDIDHLGVTFGSGAQRFTAVDDVSFSLQAGESLGLVGESGSGKSTVLRAITGLNPISQGAIRIEGKPLGTGRDMSFFRMVQMVFQDPYASLHPRHTVDQILSEPLSIHRIRNTADRIVTALKEVGLGPGFRFRYPHQLSGGQRQRVAIARALILRPRLILLDEPTSALDASVQAEILNLLEELRAQHGLTYVLVSHDLAVVAHLCERIIVMRHGSIIEQTSAAALRRGDVASDYTREMLQAEHGFVRRPKPAAAQ